MVQRLQHRKRKSLYSVLFIKILTSSVFAPPMTSRPSGQLSLLISTVVSRPGMTRQVVGLLDVVLPLSVLMRRCLAARSTGEVPIVETDNIFHQHIIGRSFHRRSTYYWNRSYISSTYYWPLIPLAKFLSLKQITFHKHINICLFISTHTFDYFVK